MSGEPTSSDRARRILDDLIRQRQEMLRHETSDPTLLEANRLSLVYWQAQVSRAEIAVKSVPTAA